MATHILLAPVGAGKTESVLNRLLQTLDEQPLAKVWVLLATRRQTDAFRQRLAEGDSARRVFFNVEFFDFYRLYRRLLDMTGKPQRPLTETARRQLLRALLAQMQPTLAVYRSIARTPGFARIVADFIYELKQHRIEPETYSEAALSPKDHDLARIYTAYQNYLQKYRLMDKEGEGWLAVRALEQDPTLAGDLALLLVDGFDQFTPVQADLLQLLANRAGDTLITLTTVTEREATVGRRFQKALDDLRQRFVEEPLIIERRTAAGEEDRHPDLRHIVENIFRRDLPQLGRGSALPLRQTTPNQRASSGGITFIEAPDATTETGAVLRRVKRLLLNGVAPEEILIALRDWESYRRHFAALKRKYRLPLALHYGEPLAENPAIIALVNLLQLHETDFRRRDVLDTLRSPYFAFPANLDADHLERIGQKFLVLGGRDEWLRAIEQASQSTHAEDGETEPALLDDESALRLAVALNSFFARVTPPPQATWLDYVLWVEALIGADTDNEEESAPTEDAVPGDNAITALNLLARLRDETTPETIIARDLTALAEFKRALRGMLAASELVDSTSPHPHPTSPPDPLSVNGEGGKDTIPWEQFAADLLGAIGSTAADTQPSHCGQVLVTTAVNARGLPHQHVFILGLSEGLFPAQTPEDPLYLDSERQILQEAGIPLPTRLERRADDGLFYELICLPRESLTLSRPTLTEGELWAASPLWRATTALFSDAAALIDRKRIGVGAVIQLDDVAALDEAAVTVADGLNQPADEVTQPTRHAWDWLQTAEPTYWESIAAGRTSEAGRMSAAPFDHYSGRLRDERLIEQVAQTLDSRRMWSASQFNDLGMCGFRFFANRLLKLVALKEPEEGMDVMQRGTINHEILERTYRRLQEHHTPIHSDHLGEALAILREVAAEVLRRAPQQLGFRVSALWEQEKTILRRKLEKLVELDFTESPIAEKFASTGRIPYLLEASFGIWNDEGQRVNLTIDLGAEVGAVKALGFIDRIDQTGDAVIVIDYKSGSAKIPVEELQAGRNFQMLVYLLGAAAILRARARVEKVPSHVAGGLFWHISNRTVSGVLHLDDEGTAIIEQAKERLAEQITRARRGDFPVQPRKMAGGRCGYHQYCDFQQLCRESITHRRKA